MTVEIPKGTWTIDAAHTEIGFSIKHLTVSKVKGVFEGVTGQITSDGTLEGISVTASIDVASVNTKVKDRDAHLRSADFFDAEKYPTIDFASTGVRTDGDDYLLDGNLTIKDVTRPVTLKVEYGGIAKSLYGQTVAGAEADVTISRTDFGLTYNAALETGGFLLGDDVVIHIEVEAIEEIAAA